MGDEELKQKKYSMKKTKFIDYYEAKLKREVAQHGGKHFVGTGVKIVEDGLCQFAF